MIGAKMIKWLFLSILVGLLSGVSSAVFLILLEWVTQLRLANQWIIWFLPLAGLAIGWVYHHYAGDAGQGHNLILDEIHDPKNTLPLKMAPLVLLGTVITHLFGGSAGREGTAVQMAASLSDQLSRFFSEGSNRFLKVNQEERKILLLAGIGAGFGSAIGAPLAGAIFGMEVVTVGRLHLRAWPQCLIASFVGYYTCVMLAAPHSVFPSVVIPEVQIKTLLFVVIAGILFGQTAKLFVYFTHQVEATFSKYISAPYLKPFLGGVLLVALYYGEGSYHYAGLGILIIQSALQEPATFMQAAYKMFFTGLTVGSGFKGGEFVPLVFIGATLGSAMSFMLPLAFSFLSALGFSAVFAGAANTPFACAVMCAEIFGWKIFPFSLLVCYVSYHFSGNRGIYKSQRIYDT